MQADLRGSFGNLYRHLVPLILYYHPGLIGRKNAVTAHSYPEYSSCTEFQLHFCPRGGKMKDVPFPVKILLVIPYLRRCMECIDDCQTYYKKRPQHISCR